MLTTVSGIVRLAPAYTPAPAGTVAVTAYRLNDDGAGVGPESAPVLVGDGGRYSLSLSSGSYWLRYVYVGGGEPYAELPPHLYDFNPVKVSGSPVEVALQTMYPQNSLSGVVTLGLSNATPAGAGQVRVTLETAAIGSSWDGPWVRRDADAALTDASGRFTIRHVPDTLYRLNYEWVGQPEAAYEPALAKRYGSYVENRGYAVGLDWPLARNGSFTGRIFLGDTGHPAGPGQAKVTARQGTTVFGTTTTGADGHYTITGLPESTYTLDIEYIGPEPYAPMTTSASDSGSFVTTFDATLVLKREAISGHVRTSSGEPVQGVRVSLWAYALDGTVDPDGGSWTTTDESGWYSFPALDSTHLFSLQYNGNGPQQVWPNSGMFYEPGYIRLQPHQVRTDVDVVMYRPVYPTGFVSATGVPMEEFELGGVGIEVLVHDALTSTWVHTGVGIPVTNTNGFFEMFDLPPDDYRFQTTYLGAHGESAVTSPVVHLEEGARPVLTSRIRPFLRDLTNDRAPDLLVRNGAGQLVVYPTNGRGSFLAPRAVGAGWSGMTAVIAAGDMNGDGTADVLARDASGSLWLYPGNGRGGWRARAKIGGGWNSMTALLSPGDFDGDGKTDVMARDTAGSLWLYRGNGRGGLLSRVKVGAGWNAFNAIATASDLNEDGFPDVAARDASGTLWLYPGNGTGGWKVRSRIGVGWGSMTFVGVGDVDGDWDPDLLARDSAGKLWLYPGTGTGTLGPRRMIGTGWGSLRVAG